MKLLIVGVGGQGRVVLDCAKLSKRYSRIDFMAADVAAKPVEGHALISEDAYTFAQLKDVYDEAIVAVGNNALRYKKSMELTQNGIRLATLLHPTSAVSNTAYIDEGSVAFAYSVINPNARVGKACIINTGAIVEHDCVISDGVQISPNAALGGGVSIGKASWVCIGSCVSNHITIGENVVVGAGATVLSDVPDNVLVAGTPAKIKKQYI